MVENAQSSTALDDGPPPAPLPLQSAGASGRAPLAGPAKAYLVKLLENIDIILTYANSMGKPIPDDLRRKLDELLADSEVQALLPPVGRSRTWWQL